MHIFINITPEAESITYPVSQDHLPPPELWELVRNSFADTLSRIGERSSLVTEEHDRLPAA